MENSDDIKVCYDKKGLFLLALGLLLFIIVSLYLIINADYIALHYDGVSRYNYPPLFLKVLGWGSFLFFGMLGGIGFFKTLLNPVYLILNNKGITMKQEGFISWKEIDDIYYIRVKGTAIFILKLNDKCAERIRDNYNFIYRLLFKNNELGLNTNFLNLSTKNLYRTILKLKRNSLKNKI